MVKTLQGISFEVFEDQDGNNDTIVMLPFQKNHIY